LEKKYLKYKLKYIQLKSQLGGVRIEDLTKNGYDTTNETDINAILELYNSNPKLEQFIKYKPNKDTLKYIRNNLPYIDLINELLQNSYNIDTIKDVLDLYIDNLGLMQFIKYTFSKTQLGYIIEHIYLINKVVQSGYNIYQLTKEQIIYLLEHIKLINTLLDNKHNIHEILDVLYLYINNQSLTQFIKYKPNRDTLIYIRHNLMYIELINTLLENGYNVNAILQNENNIIGIKDVLDLYVTNPHLEQFIKYNPNTITLIYIRDNLTYIALIYNLLQNKYNINMIPNVLDLYLTTPELQQFIEYSPNRIKLEFIRDNLTYIDLINKLLKKGYSIGILGSLLDKTILQFYIRYPILERFARYTLDATQLQIILDNLDKIEQIYDLLSKFVLFDDIKRLIIGQKDISFVCYRKQYIEFIENFNSSVNYIDTGITVNDNYNIGIEIEGCGRRDIQLTLTYFYKDIDGSIVCANDEERPYEFILETPYNSNQIADLESDLEIILNVLSDNGKRPICKKDCGIHFHVSNEYILLNLYGLLFLANLIILWLGKWQDIFIQKYPYQLRLFDISYSIKNNANNLPLIITYRDEIIQQINEEKFDNYVFILNMMRDLRAVNNKAHFLNVYDDYKYIHIEFRGLASINDFINVPSFTEYITGIKQFYKEAMDNSMLDGK